MVKPGKPPEASLWKTHAPVAVALVFGVSITLIAYASVRNDARRALQAEFDRAAAARVEATRRNLRTKLLILESLQSLYTASGTLSRTDVLDFVGPLESHMRGVLGLEMG